MLVTWSIVAFLISSLCWILGDALIVGFHRPDRSEHGDFIDLMGDDAYAFYTRINEPRLRWGALVANYSVPLMLAGLYAHWVLLRGSPVGTVGLLLLGIGFSLSPLAHASFYPLALASERAHAAYRTYVSAKTMSQGDQDGEAPILPPWRMPAGSTASSCRPGSPPSG